MIFRTRLRPVVAQTAEQKWMKGRSDMKIKNGYHKLSLIEPLILEPKDWSAAEWATLCKICDLPVGPTQRIVLHLNTMEFFEDPAHPTHDPNRT